MDDLEFGPVELVLAAFDGDEPSPDVIEAVMKLADAGTIRLLDLAFVSRTVDGDITIVEIEDAGSAFDDLDLVASGIASSEDLDELGSRLPPGSSAILLVVELLWARHLASQLAASGGFVVDAMRIPAPAVNAVVAEARAAG